MTTVIPLLANRAYLRSMDAHVSTVGVHGAYVVAEIERLEDKEARAAETGAHICMDCGEPMLDYVDDPNVAPDYCDSFEGDHEDEY